jgi:hypothetical protein
MYNARKEVNGFSSFQKLTDIMSRNKHATNEQWNINKLKQSGNYMYHVP